METVHNGNGSTGEPPAPQEQPLPEIITAAQIVETFEPPKRETKLLTTDLPEVDCLSELQREFVTEYLRTGSASKAGAHVGFKYPSVYGPRLLKNVVVREAINEALRAKQIDEVQVLSELSELAYVSMSDFMDVEGRVLPKQVKKLGHLVRKLKVTERVNEEGATIIKTEIELHDRQQALLLVGRKYRMFGQEQVEGGATQNNLIVQLVLQAADSELPKELAGRLLAKVADGMKGLKGT